MKTSRKLITALAVFAAGSVFYGSLPAQAKGIEANGAKIVMSRHHGDMPPPPPPEFYRHHWRHGDVPPLPPPPHHHRHHRHYW